MDATLVDLLHSLGLVADDQRELLTAIADAPTEALIEVREHLRSAAAAVVPDQATDRDLETLAACGAGVKAIGAEFTRRSGDATKRSATAAQLIASLTASADNVPPPPDAPRLPSISRLAARSPRTHRPVAGRSAGPQVLTASGEPAGEDEFLGIVGRALEHEYRGRGGWEGGPEMSRIASLKFTYPDERTLDGDEVVNLARIEAVTSPSALVASGGVCAPVNVSYAVAAIGSAQRPVRDALGAYGANRGGVRFVRPMTLAQVHAAGPSLLWTEANDVSLAIPTKPHAVYTCQPVQETLLDAVTSIVQFGNFQQRYFPEAVAEYMTTAYADHARLAEATLLANISAGSTHAFADTGLIGAARELLAVIDRGAAAIRYRHRTAPETPLRLLYPEWLEDEVRADLARSLPGDSGGQSERLAIADAEIDRWFAVRNINVTTTLDSPTGAPVFQGFGAQGDHAPLNPWPTKVQMWLYPEGSWLWLDGGVLDLGVLRDSFLSQSNDLQMWMESFEQTAFVGHESLEITAELCASGATSGTVDAASLCLSSS
jgi:hypothetical protein